MQNGVSLDVYEGEIQARNMNRKGTSKKKTRGKKGEKKIKEKKKKKRKRKRRRDSLDPSGSGLSHFEGNFLKF